MKKIKLIRDYKQKAQLPALPQASPRGGLEGATFNGIPYSVIISALLSMFGFHDGVVPEGVRNTTLYKLARQLRYICDFNPAHLRQVLPDWGLTATEVEGTIASAVGSTRGQDFPIELRKVLDDITKPDLSTSAKRQEYLERLNPLPKKMPWLFDYIYKRYGRNGRSALIAALPMLGTLLGRFESKYLDGRKHRPVFMVVVCGHAGSGKGFLSDLQEWLLKKRAKRSEAQNSCLKSQSLASVSSMPPLQTVS